MLWESLVGKMVFRQKREGQREQVHQDSPLYKVKGPRRWTGGPLGISSSSTGSSQFCSLPQRLCFPSTLRRQWTPSATTAAQGRGRLSEEKSRPPHGTQVLSTRVFVSVFPRTHRAESSWKLTKAGAPVSTRLAYLV